MQSVSASNAQNHSHRPWQIVCTMRAQMHTPAYLSERFVGWNSHCRAAVRWKRKTNTHAIRTKRTRIFFFRKGAAPSKTADVCEKGTFLRERSRFASNPARLENACRDNKKRSGDQDASHTSHTAPSQINGGSSPYRWTVKSGPKAYLRR